MSYEILGSVGGSVGVSTRRGTVRATVGVPGAVGVVRSGVYGGDVGDDEDDGTIVVVGERERDKKPPPRPPVIYIPQPVLVPYPVTPPGDGGGGIQLPRDCTQACKAEQGELKALDDVLVEWCRLENWCVVDPFCSDDTQRQIAAISGRILEKRNEAWEACRDCSQSTGCPAQCNRTTCYLVGVGIDLLE